jgi:tRNA (cmo5U34)-methyltransferase
MTDTMKRDTVFATDGPINDFKFDESVADVFDDMVSRSVPMYGEMQKMLAQLGAQYVQEDSTVYDLGCATGTTLVNLARHIPGSVRLVGIDLAAPMLEEARRKCAKYGLAERCELRSMDLNEPLDLKDASLVIMAWTLQFVRPLRRDALIRSIYDGMRPKGILLIAEKVLVADPALNRLYIDFYLNYKRSQGYSELEISKKREALENVMIPYRVEENVELLQRNGFPVVDTFFRWYNWAGFLAIKG